MTYIIESEYLTDAIEINIVQNISGGGENSLIVYESPGSNGGILINAGRLNETVTFTGKILSKLKYPTSISVIQDDIINKASELWDIKDNGYPITIKGNLPTNKTGEFLIRGFNYVKPEGQLKYLEFTMTLEEHRQINIRQNQINLIGAEVVRKMRERKIERGYI